MAIKQTDQQLKSMQNKNTIFSTALRLFNEYGYNIVTVDDICRESNLSKGTFYYYFKAKEDLVILAFFQEMDKYLEKYFVLDDTKPLNEQLTSFIQCMFHYAQSKGKEWTRQSYIGQIRTQIELMIEGRVMVTINYHLIQRGIHEKAFRLNYTEQEFYTAIIGTFTGLLIKWCTDVDNKYDYEKFITNQVLLLFKEDLFIE